ncbi:MAG: hypothetical protein ABEJ23_04995 [Haloarculaceae archaeon]
MRTVRDEDGRSYLLLKSSSESCLVRDPETGEERYLPADRLASVSESPLATAARAVPERARQVLSAVHDDRSLGLLLELDREPRAIRTLLDATDLCESDLLGLLTEFRAAGLLAETDVRGERGYRTTDAASEGLAHLRADGD